MIYLMTHTKKPIFCLLINERSLDLVENKETMKDVIKDISPSEQIFITAISIDEYAKLGQTMGKMNEKYISRIKSDDLHEVLQATVEKGVYGMFHEILAERLNNLKPSYWI